MGSSPHVRGAHAVPRLPVAAHGIIPACAGARAARPRRPSARRDHPRICGEHCSMTEPSLSMRGSSPTCAGSTDSGLVPSHSHRDHPRMCGEHSVPSPGRPPLAGSSPHVRGAHIPLPIFWRGGVGSSPHVRGALVFGNGGVDVDGIIPACTGSTSTPAPRRTTSRDHPRMYGEHSCHSAMICGVPGSSPHVRGARIFRPFYYSCVGIIPACTGSTQNVRTFLASRLGSSPHVRGAPEGLAERNRGNGIIPACTGSTHWLTQLFTLKRDHPRMYGEHA